MILIRISDARDAARHLSNETFYGAKSPRSRAGLQYPARGPGVLTAGAGLPRDKHVTPGHRGVPPLLPCKPRNHTAGERTFRSTLHSLALAATINNPL